MFVNIISCYVENEIWNVRTAYEFIHTVPAMKIALVLSRTPQVYETWSIYKLSFFEIGLLDFMIGFFAPISYPYLPLEP